MCIPVKIGQIVCSLSRKNIHVQYISIALVHLLSPFIRFGASSLPKHGILICVIYGCVQKVLIGQVGNMDLQSVICLLYDPVSNSKTLSNF